MDEPDLVYDPDTHQISSASGANALEVSLKVLEESLESGAALAQFEVILVGLLHFPRNYSRVWAQTLMACLLRLFRTSS